MQKQTFLSYLVENFIVEIDDEDKDLDRAPPPGKTGEFITSAQAARMLKVSMSRIRQMVADGTLNSYQPEKGRRDHLLKRKDVQSVRDTARKVGRPAEDDKEKE